MCGFLLEFSTRGLIGKYEFDKLLKQSQARGPDHVGYWSNNLNVQSGFNRLSIQDVSEAGSQPMLSPSGRFLLVFNGEIYNHLELRRQLSFENYAGHSDTETVTACLDEWGIERTVNALDGMFAMVLYDRDEDCIYLVRDFAGIKPLFYGWNGKVLVAASQYDQLARHPSFSNESYDPSVLKLFLQQHYIPAPFGLIRNTFQVSPGEIVELSREGILTRRTYWKLPEWEPATEFEDNRALKLVREMLFESVRAEMLSDVPLGAFLSGGVDSPLVCAMAVCQRHGLKTFTVGSDSPVHDETNQAAKFAAALETDHVSERMCASNAASIWSEVMRCIHEPIGDFSIIPTYLVSRLARQHVTVALSGDGGDELFFGYERFWSVAKNIRVQGWPWPVKAGLYKLDQWLSGNRHVNDVVLSATQGEAHQALHSRFPAMRIDRLFPHLAGVNLPDNYRTYDYGLQGSLPHLLQQMRRAEFYGMMQKTLRKVDLASMENSLEVRVPFLKKSVIEASLKLDPFLSYGPGRKKMVLKRLLTQEIPGAPVDEVKRGFSVPLGKWFREDLRDQVTDTLTSAGFLGEFGVEKAAIDSLLADHHRGEDLKWPIFTLAALDAWRKNARG